LGVNSFKAVNLLRSRLAYGAILYSFDDQAVFLEIDDLRGMWQFLFWLRPRL